MTLLTISLLMTIALLSATTTTGLISDYSQFFNVDASVEDQEPTDDTNTDSDIPNKPKHDADKDGTSDDLDDDDDDDGRPDKRDDDDDDDDIPDERDTDDDNDNVPDDQDTDDDNDNLPDDQDTDDDNDGIPDGDEIPIPTPLPIPADDNGTIPVPTPVNDNGTIPANNNDTQSNATQPNLERATLSITSVLRANCGFWHPCEHNFMTDGEIDINDRIVGQGGVFIPKSLAREGTDHYSIELPVGQQYKVTAEDGYHTWVYQFDTAFFQGPCQTPQGQLPTVCLGTMTSGGQSIVVNLYYACKDTAC